MKELEYLEIINNTLTDSSLLGDDCAYLKEFDLCITQDALVEGVHFTLDTITPFQLGQKAVNVNLSDIAASGSEPVYITISLSLPGSVSAEFLEEFYKGVNEVCTQHSVKVAGGDLTGSDKIFVSVCAIGKKYNSVSVSRNASKPDDIIITTGTHGDSAGGLKLLQQGKTTPEKLINKHLLAQSRTEQSRIIIQAAEESGLKQLAMMDTSDGLGDAIYKLSKGCGFAFDIDFDSVPVSRELKKTFPDEYKDLVLWGGEDFELLFTMPEHAYEKLDKAKFFKIGRVTEKPFSKADEEIFENKSFKHFED